MILFFTYPFNSSRTSIKQLFKISNYLLLNLTFVNMTNELIFFSNNYNLPFCKNLFHQHSLNKMKLNIEILLNHKSYYNIQYNTRWQILLIIKIIFIERNQNIM